MQALAEKKYRGLLRVRAGKDKATEFENEMAA